MLMRSNVHERVYPVPPAELGRLLDTVAGPDDRVWPEGWPPIRFDRGLQVGAVGGHGPIRYSVITYRPGRLIEFRFDPSIGISGTHGLEVRDGERPGTSLLRHVLVWRGHGIARFVFGWTVLKLHDAALEDLLDRVGVQLGHPPARFARWSPWVRLLRLIVRARPAAAVSEPSVTGRA